MPSGKTHDLLTVVLAPAAAAAVYYVTRDPIAAAVAVGGELFGGFMFGPDLDTDSRPYRRWGPARVLWYPYRRTIKHRSRLSHGLLLGTVIRVVYFAAVLGAVAGVSLALRDFWLHGVPISASGLLGGAERVWSMFAAVEPRLLLAAFAGLWIGAAIHTLADVVGSTLKQIWHAL